MDREEILNKIEQREFELRCFIYRICPECGGDLRVEASNRGGKMGTCKMCRKRYEGIGEGVN